MKRTRLISLVLGCFAIAIMCFTWYIVHNFGHVNIAQILFNMEMPITGVDTDYIESAFEYSELCISLMCIWSILIYCYKYIVGLYILVRNKASEFKNKILSAYNTEPHNSKRYNIIICSLSILAILSSIILTAKEFHVSDLLEMEVADGPDFIKDNYYTPEMESITFDKKNNLVVVLVESMENAFTGDSSDEHLTPSLDKFRQESQCIQNMVQTAGTDWTIAAFTGWAFGIPLKLPKFTLPKYIRDNSYTSKRGFLPNARSIFEVLQKNGYELVMVMGSDSRFSGFDILLKGHGNFRILDKAYWANKKWRLRYHQGTKWGYNDRFVLNRAIDEYKKLSKSGKPFALFVQTIDTHTPHGYCPPEKIKFHDIRDAIIETDSHLGNFISSFKEMNKKNDMLAVIGDHNFMGATTFLEDNIHRTIYNAFYGNVHRISDLKKRQKITAMDIAPTLLQCAGAKWENNRFGIGVSLFSDEKSLVEEIGEEQLQHDLEKYSEFYTTFY